MSYADALLPELDQEMASTARLLRCVPDDKASFRPHPKSSTLGDLAMHIATLPGLGLSVLTQTEHDFAPPGGPPRAPRKFESTLETVKQFEANVAKARAALAETTDAQMMASWALKNGGKVIFTQSRLGLMRTLLLNHIIHHRGQMSVYLRLCDVPLPSIYGPTADAPM
jgi:uncharacterized damage-inducible protein DinB